MASINLAPILPNASMVKNTICQTVVVEYLWLKPWILMIGKIKQQYGLEQLCRLLSRIPGQRTKLTASNAMYDNYPKPSIVCFDKYLDHVKAFKVLNFFIRCATCSFYFYRGSVCCRSTIKSKA